MSSMNVGQTVPASDELSTTKSLSRGRPLPDWFTISKAAKFDSKISFCVAISKWTEVIPVVRKSLIAGAVGQYHPYYV
jgi:hypothetical protein